MPPDSIDDPVLKSPAITGYLGSVWDLQSIARCGGVATARPPVGHVICDQG